MRTSVCLLIAGLAWSLSASSASARTQEEMLLSTVKSPVVMRKLGEFVVATQNSVRMLKIFNQELEKSRGGFGEEGAKLLKEVAYTLAAPALNSLERLRKLTQHKDPKVREDAIVAVAAVDDKYTTRPIHYLALRGDLKSLQVCLGRVPSLITSLTPPDKEYAAHRIKDKKQVSVSSRATVLGAAIKSGSLETVRWLVQRGARLDQPCEREAGPAPLWYALEAGEPEIAGYLVTKGVDVRITDAESGKGLLHLAVERSASEVVRMLIDKGVEVNARDREGRTALKLAMDSNQTDLAQFLRERGGTE